MAKKALERLYNFVSQIYFRQNQANSTVDYIVCKKFLMIYFASVEHFHFQITFIFDSM